MANLYTIKDLLIGKTYNSKTLRGEIISADKSDVWYENAESYLVQIRSNTGIRLRNWIISGRCYLMINSVMRFDCNECSGSGLIFWGDNDNYDVETCECEVLV